MPKRKTLAQQVRVLFLSSNVLKSAGSILLCQVASGDPFLYLTDIILIFFYFDNRPKYILVSKESQMKRALRIHMSVVVMNTIPFSTDVAAAAFQYNHYIQYKLWVTLCFVKTGHEHTSKVFEPASNEAERALYSTSFLFENISVVKCTAAYADWNRRLAPFIPVNLLLLTYIRAFLETTAMNHICNTA